MSLLPFLYDDIQSYRPPFDLPPYIHYSGTIPFEKVIGGFYKILKQVIL